MQAWALENVEGGIGLFVVVKNQNCQAYLCVLFLFRYSLLPCRLI